MTIGIRIDPDAFEPGQPLEAFKLRASPAHAGSLQYPEVPLPIGTTGETGAPGPDYGATSSPTGRFVIHTDSNHHLGEELAKGDRDLLVSLW